MSEDTVRISVPIPREINDKLNKYIPAGMKATVVRELLTLLIDTQIHDPNAYIVESLLRKQVKFSVQKLNRSDHHD